MLETCYPTQWQKSKTSDFQIIICAQFNFLDSINLDIFYIFFFLSKMYLVYAILTAMTELDFICSYQV